MFIERKTEDLVGEARIARVRFSKSGKSIFYRGRELVSLNGGGIKANYRDFATGEDYWISGCKKNGEDTLFPGVIQIDDDVRKEYWCSIRKMPEKKFQRSFKSLGKYSK
jgi:hypothetical protein